MPLTKSSEVAKIFASSLAIGSVSFFRGIETTKPNNAIIDFDLCGEFPVMPSDAFKRTVSFRFPTGTICCICRIICFAKVRPMIVARIAIDMIDNLFRPIARYVKQSKTSGWINHFINADLSMPRFCDRPGADASASKAAGAINAPSEYAGFGIIVEQFLQPGGRQRHACP